MKKVSTGVSSLVCGILSILFFLIAFFGLILGIIAIVLSRRANTGMATAGKVLGIIGIILNSIPTIIVLTALLLQWG